ncbi:hypothetical protein XGA_1415 [Xanthomonas hortorum ATCC 19865]|nr:hypothetical protein XGA_1415 [Xanthomonas hortorum ATCC 19865]
MLDAGAGVAVVLVCAGADGVAGLSQAVRVASTASSTIKDGEGRRNDSVMAITDWGRQGDDQAL